MLRDYDRISWKDIFFKANFNVDQCLSTHTQKTDLETLRSELRQYGTELHSTMSEILKTETEAIVYLAENLTNLSGKIDGLSVPVSQLLEEIRCLHDSIRKVQEEFQHHLEFIKSNAEESKQLKLQMDMVLSSLYVNNILKLNLEEADENLIYLERAVNKYSFQKMYLCEVGAKTDDVSDTMKMLIEHINLFFLTAIKQNDAQIITRCLRMFVDLGLQSKAELFYREKIVRPVLRSIFTQKNLDKHHQELGKIYKEALYFLNTNMTVLLEVLERNLDLKGFNFILNSFWLEVDKQLKESLPNVTAPGNPDLFQKRFKETWEFFMQIASKCNNLQLLKNDHTFQDHIKRFNLPVYFEIRFQQIVAKLEEELLVNTFVTENISQQEHGFNLKITTEIWRSINRCFSSDVYLELLSDQFLKLSMLILSRYLTWLDNCIPTLKQQDDRGELFLLHAVIDIELLENLLGNQHDTVGKTVYKVFPKTMHHLLFEVQRSNAQLLRNHRKKIQDILVQIKVQECTEHLAKVDSIPRLYRRTNRNFPKDASQYVISAMNIVKNFHSVCLKYKTSDGIAAITESLIMRITNQYVNHVQDVLRNVCKTEESLRRLKNRNQPITEDSGNASGDTSDEKKIREQIKLDTRYFVTMVIPLCSEGSKQALEKLCSEGGFQQ